MPSPVPVRSTFGPATFALALLAAVLLAAAPAPAVAQTSSLDTLVSAVVRIKTVINPSGRSVSSLGREREGSGIVIDENGLILTIGYIMVEADAAEVVTNDGRTAPATVVGYDHDSGFGLLRTLEPLKIKPLPFGAAADLREQDPALAVSFGGAGMVLPVHVASKRLFAGSWEYMVDPAIYTAPPHPAWSGAALISRQGKLIGVGSLIVSDASGQKDNVAGNMFVPVDMLLPILGDLLADGRASGPGKPWLGVNASEIGGKLLVGRVTPESPAAKSGLRRGDVIVGIDGSATATLPEFYRKLWSSGAAGATVGLDVLKDSETRRVDVKSVNRMDHLKLKSTF